MIDLLGPAVFLFTAPQTEPRSQGAWFQLPADPRLEGDLRTLFVEEFHDYVLAGDRVWHFSLRCQRLPNHTLHQKYDDIVSSSQGSHCRQARTAVTRYCHMPFGEQR